MLGVSNRWIQQCAKNGIITKESRGKYRVGTVVREYTQYLSDLASGRDDGSGLDAKKEQARYTKYKADMEQLKLDEYRQRMVDVTLQAEEWRNAVTTVRSKLLSLPSQVAPPLAAYDNVNDIQQHLERSIEDALTELSNIKLRTREWNTDEDEPEEENPD
jgi:phage terminase Nu1 subunit (DNA packaging protein)